MKQCRGMGSTLLTAGRVEFVHHDPVVEIPSGRSACKTADSETSQPARLDAGHSIPTLDSTLEAAISRAQVFIEIKPSGIESDVARCLKRQSDLHENYSGHSFDHRIVKRMLEMLPSVRTGILQVAYPIDSRAAMRDAGATDLWQHADFVDSRLAADVHASGGRLIVWTPNTANAWELTRGSRSRAVSVLTMWMPISTAEAIWRKSERSTLILQTIPATAKFSASYRHVP